ncbi:MAG: response regulator transcription factor [Terriglobia bacterium]
MERLLLIDDDPAIHRALRYLFESEGYGIAFATEGVAGLAIFRELSPSLVILDLKLPKMSGRDVCHEIRRLAPGVPIIILSAATDEIDKVLLLEIGADDYMTKPFSPRELLARVRTSLRRSRRGGKIEQYSFADVVVDFARMELKRDGKLVEMTPHELKVLKYFAEHPEIVISRDQLLNEVWGYECYPSTRTVDNHILKLRQKLEPDPEHPVHLRTVHGAGYKFIP